MWLRFGVAEHVEREGRQNSLQVLISAQTTRSVLSKYQNEITLEMIRLQEVNHFKTHPKGANANCFP